MSELITVMVYTCFKCLQDLNTCKLLWKHLKVHDITTKTKTKIVCGQARCTSVYYSGYSYKRHLESAHSNLQVDQVPGAFPPENSGAENEHSVDETELLDSGGETDNLAECLVHQAKEDSTDFINRLNESSLPSSTVHRIITFL